MEPLTDLLGESPGIVAIREQIRRLLQRRSEGHRLPSVLLQGETGTGKGLLARALHRAGPRADGPFVDVNCAAIPDTLLEAELFGFERGAFTDARQAKPGLFQAAHRGTIFLDEIGLLPEGLQAKLLKVLDEKVVRRLGSTRSEPADVWILAASNEDLAAATRQRRFREDLYHRLAVLTLWLPPLRERGPDILLLAEHFLTRVAADYGLPPKALSPDARAALLAYRWPGNVRELANVMERVGLLSEAPVVTVESLGLPEAPLAEPRQATREERAIPLREVVGDVERNHLIEVLRQTDWNISRAAARLGISRNTLRYRIEKYGLRPGGAPPSPRPAAPAPTVPAAGPGPAPAPAGVRWERRRLTLLRVTLLFPGEEKSALESSRQLGVLMEKVQSFCGRIEELSPTGIVAAFGIEPLEDAPRRAANAALAIRKAVEHARRMIAESQWAVKVVIHVSEVMVGRGNGAIEIDMDSKRQAWALLEEMVAAAEADAIVVTEAAATLLERRFEVLPVGALPAKVYRLSGRERAGLGLAARMARFVGRRHELELLRSRFESATRGQGQIVGIAGEPGIGKSRLLFEFRQSLTGQAFTYLEGYCLSYSSDIPYLPVLDILRAVCGITEANSPEVMAEKVRVGLQNVAMDPVEWAPYLLHLLGLKDGTDRLAVLTPEAIKARTFEALHQMSLELSRRKPLIIVVEDLHWIDKISEEYIASLMESVAGARILLVTTYRPGYRPPWIERSFATQMALQPLPPQESLALVQSVLGTDQVAGSLVALILSKAEGNPLFLEELARVVREQGGLSLAVAVPDTIEDVLLVRIDRLSPEEKHLLQAAAVIGEHIPFSLVHAIAGLPEDALRAVLTHLQAAEFLYETSVVPEPEYTFRHALTHEVAYRTLLPEQRHGLHARIVEAIERLYAGQLAEHFEQLAHHAFRGELWEKALTYLHQAGAKAASRSANREAVASFEQALVALKHLPESRQRLEQAVDLRFDLRTSLLPLGEHERLLEYLREAEVLSTALEDQRRLAWVYSYLTQYFWLMGDGERAAESGHQALGVPAAVGDFALQVATNYYLGLAYYSLGDYRLAVQFLGRIVTSLTGDLLYEHFGLSGLPSVLLRSWLAWCLAECGEFTEGVARGEEAIRIAEAVNQPFDLIQAYLGLGGVYLHKGDLRKAIQVLERGLVLCPTGNIPLLLPRVTASLGYACALSGRVAEALPLVEQAVDQAASMRLIATHSLFLGWLSEIYLLAGRLDDGMRLALLALDHSCGHKERGQQAWILRLLGEIHSQRQPPDIEKAEAPYHQALELAEELGMRPLMAHCHFGLGRLYQGTGDRSKAEERLTTAIGLFREMDMQFWLQEAEAKRKA